MGGGLMQLVAYGAQDAFLTGTPEITFFKMVYRRHTNFAMESIQQVFSGSANWGSRATATISRNGDLITKCYIECQLPALQDGVHYKNQVGHGLIKSVDLEIGGQLVDRHYGEWLEIWSELTMTAEKKEGYDNMTYNNSVSHVELDTKHSRKVFVPLQFFFCRNPGLALPLIALQYHEVKLVFEFANAQDVIQGDDVQNVEPIQPSLWVDYIYLDTDERRRFAQTQHNMLIDQLQYNGDSTSDSIYLNFNHPCKELLWVLSSDVNNTTNCFNFGSTQNGAYHGPLNSAVLKLNGHERFAERTGEYFRFVQPYQHHTRVPSKNIYCYSFALNPEEHQPSGSCNFSRIDNAQLILKVHDQLPNIVRKVYAINYNVLRIQSGMGGLAFSN